MGGGGVYKHCLLPFFIFFAVENPNDIILGFISYVHPIPFRISLFLHIKPQLLGIVSHLTFDEKALHSVNNKCAYKPANWHKSEQDLCHSLPDICDFKIMYVLFCSFIIKGQFESSLVRSPKVGLLFWASFVRKPVFEVSDQVLHKASCTATEDG